MREWGQLNPACLQSSNPFMIGPPRLLLDQQQGFSTSPCNMDITNNARTNDMIWHTEQIQDTDIKNTNNQCNTNYQQQSVIHQVEPCPVSAPTPTTLDIRRMESRHGGASLVTLLLRATRLSQDQQLPQEQEQKQEQRTLTKPSVRPPSHIPPQKQMIAPAIKQTTLSKPHSKNLHNNFDRTYNQSSS